MPGFLAPYLAKIGIAAALLAAALGVWLYVGRLEAQLSAARATISADSAKCANTQLAAGALINTATQVHVDGQQIDLDAAEAGLMPASTVSQAAGAAIAATVKAQAAQPGEDGPVPLVLVQAVSGLGAVQ